ncbi:L-aspartate oxidase [Agromyces sp. CF514]|uniref:L-aspartate oxidase n=1 Tax=Agromyces sp. CF514 TaxID=1881031 RepID=UPI0008F2A19D|nr:L-aspartate oxidase [Agromyces sp. CF514]SFR74250.1 L-aspartate oxidase [Agromyces sp. CF514]
MVHVLVVGGGIAGLWTAVRAADAGHDVELVTKTELADGNTRHAQGGIAAALFPDDSAARHYADTLAAGAGLCDPEAVRVLCDEGPARVRDLIRFGVAFDHGDSGLSRGLEAAHSRARILHAGGDATGAAIERALVATVRRRAVRIHEQTMLVDLLTEGAAGGDAPADGGGDSGADSDRPDGVRVVGARLLAASGDLIEVRADAVVLATGGAGQLFRHTTNPDVATGDGVAAAWRAGAEIADLEFVQFHPTALAAPGTPLISEAVRGEGAVLRDRDGNRFMLELHPEAELAPRDVVARAVWRRSLEQGGEPVTLDATALGREFLDRRFPGLGAACRDAGHDWAVEPVPVTPAAHYAMGGVVTDLDGRTSLPGLYAVGETARTGVHGANRLASNSLLEAAVFADRAARALDADALSSASPLPSLHSPNVGSIERLAGHGAHARGASLEASDIRRMPMGAAEQERASARAARETGEPVDRAALQALMWEHVGLERSAEGLAEASDALEGWRSPEVRDRRSAEDRNLLDLARLTVAAASARSESLGAHFRSDAAATAARIPAEPGAGDAHGAPSGSAPLPLHDLVPLEADAEEAA